MTAKLQATRDYSLFELYTFNRPILERRVTRLMGSMKSHGWVDAYPMHVIRNGSMKLKIKAGHHRFIAAKRLGIPVKYVICEDDTTTIWGLEESRPQWTLHDYVDSHARAGSAAHSAILEYSARTGINVSQSAALLQGHCAASGQAGRRLKDGTFTLGDMAHADIVARLVLGAQRVGVSFATNPKFVAALSYVSWLDEFDTDVFLRRLGFGFSSGIAAQQPTRDSYVAMIEAVYNNRAQKKVAIAFLAKEHARKREMRKH